MFVGLTSRGLHGPASEARASDLKDLTNQLYGAAESVLLDALRRKAPAGTGAGKYVSNHSVLPLAHGRQGVK